MMLDVATDRSLTPEPVKAELLQKATECLILLDHASHGQVKVSKTKGEPKVQQACDLGKSRPSAS